MVETDFWQRGVPWVELLLRAARTVAALNLGWRHRASALASVVVAVSLAARAAAPALGALAVLVALNAPFYELLARRRGRREAAIGVGLHALHHVDGALSVPVGVARTSAPPHALTCEFDGSRPAACGRKRRSRGVRRYLPGGWSDETLPVNVFLVEHPAGLCLFDTGQTRARGGPGYHPRWHPFLRLARFELGPDDEIGAQLDPGDVRWVVLSHLHTDHVGGVGAFPGRGGDRVEDEWERATGSRGGCAATSPSTGRPGRARARDVLGPPAGPFPAPTTSPATARCSSCRRPAIRPATRGCSSAARSSWPAMRRTRRPG